VPFKHENTIERNGGIHIFVGRKQEKNNLHVSGVVAFNVI
jgi:hypothetical protein